jgi:hypothetical protein
MRLDARQARLACRLVARATSGPKSATPANLYSCQTLLERLARDLQDMAAASNHPRHGMDMSGCNGFREGHGRQDGGEPPWQHPRENPTLSGMDTILHSN